MDMGIQPQVIYAVTRSAVEDNAAKQMSQKELVQNLGTNALQLPQAKIPFVWTLSPLLHARRQLRQHNILMVVCGSVHVGYSLTLMRRPYLLWVGTLWEDELIGQVENGDPHARRLMRSPIYPILRWQERQTLRGAATILTNSHHTANRIREYVPTVADRVEAIITPCDVELFHPDDAVRANPPYGQYILLTARINDPRKNIPLMLEAFSQVRQLFPHLRLVLAGEAPNQAILSKVDELGLKEDVIFPGYTSMEDLVRLYQGATLYALSSNQEGLGLVLLEAMACGTPVVSTRSGGPENIVDDSVGRLTPLHDATALADAICDLLSNRAQLEAMRQTCVQRVREQYSMQAQRRQLEAKLRATFPHAFTKDGVG